MKVYICVQFLETKRQKILRDRPTYCFLVYLLDLLTITKIEDITILILQITTGSLIREIQLHLNATNCNYCEIRMMMSRVIRDYTAPMRIGHSILSYDILEQFLVARCDTFYNLRYQYSNSCVCVFRCS